MSMSTAGPALRVTNFPLPAEARIFASVCGMRGTYEGAQMARQERPIDPGAGPLQRFAWELRKARVEAGNPTYRALARTAGYSASTLSEAAAGIRQPSLDVVLAYVGACGGDTADWRERWLELDAELHDPGLQTTAHSTQHDVGSDRTLPLPQTGSTAPMESAASATEDPPHPVPAGRRGRRAVRAAMLGVLLIVLGTAGVVIVRYLAPASRATSAADADCPAMPPLAAFTGRTYGSGVHVRTGASRDDPIVFTIPPNCKVGFTGYCIGEPIYDATAQTPDVRWLRLPGGGVVASALVHGNPPTNLAPGRCRDALPQPESIALQVTADPRMPDTLLLRATGRFVHITGFTAFYPINPASPGRRRWQQITLTGEAAPDFLVRWRLGPVRNQPTPTEQFLVAAVACLGGEGPTDVLDVLAVHADGTSSTLPTRLHAGQRATAERSACLYPTAN